jgi:hypothetical protein
VPFKLHLCSCLGIAVTVLLHHLGIPSLPRMSSSSG